MLDNDIREFLAGERYAVAGASRSRSKYGNRVLRVYLQHGRTVYPVNPNTDEVEGLQAYPDLLSLPETVHGVSIITPPHITEKIVADAAEAGIKHVWMQPGAESTRAVDRARELGLNVIAGGPCLLVVWATISRRQGHGD